MPNPRIEPLKRVLAIEPTDEVAWFGLGKAYMEDGNFDEAAKALQQCVTVKPTYSAAYFALAQSLHKLGRIDECRAVSVTGIEVSTKNGDAMVTQLLWMHDLDAPILLIVLGAYLVLKPWFDKRQLFGKAEES